MDIKLIAKKLAAELYNVVDPYYFPLGLEDLERFIIDCLED